MTNAIEALQACRRAWERSQPQLPLELYPELPEARLTAATDTAPLNGSDGTPPAAPLHADPIGGTS